MPGTNLPPGRSRCHHVSTSALSVLVVASWLDWSWSVLSTKGGTTCLSRPAWLLGEVGGWVGEVCRYCVVISTLQLCPPHLSCHLVLAHPLTYNCDAFRHQELVRLTFETIRERYHAMPLPSQIAKILTAPREAILNRVRMTANVHQTIDFTVPTVLHASFLSPA